MVGRKCEKRVSGDLWGLTLDSLNVLYLSCPEKVIRASLPKIKHANGGQA